MGIHGDTGGPEGAARQHTKSWRVRHLRYNICIIIHKLIKTPNDTNGINSFIYRTMWSYLRHMAEFLENVASAMDGISSKDIENLKNEMSVSNRRRTSFSVATRPKHSSHLLSVKVYPGVTGIISSEKCTIYL